MSLPQYTSYAKSTPEYAQHAAKTLMPCLIGFAGPRVIKETIKRELPEGFQTAEFLLEKGFLDFIVDRKNLKDTMRHLLVLFAKN